MDKDLVVKNLKDESMVIIGAPDADLEFLSNNLEGVMNGLGISFLPFYAVKNEVGDGSLKILEVDDSLANFRTQLVYHKNKSISIPMSKLIEMALKEVF